MMKKTYLLILSLLITVNIFSQIQYSQSNITNQSFIKNLSGPRIGFTIISNGDLKEDLVSEFGLTSNIISQFGYQFEKQMNLGVLPIMPWPQCLQHFLKDFLVNLVP